MFSLGNARYYIYREATDMRKSFDGLCGLVSGRLGKSPMSGDVFIFINKSRNRIKLLRWEPGGFVLFYKRLERGTFESHFDEILRPLTRPSIFHFKKSFQEKRLWDYCRDPVRGGLR